MAPRNPEVRRRFWEAKLRIARTNHAAELRKMTGEGASFTLLERYAVAIEKAARELRKIEEES